MHANLRNDGEAEKFVLTSALTFNPLPRGEEMAVGRFRFYGRGPANPVTRILKWTEDDSPSPWGEGRDEGGRFVKIFE